MPVIALLHFQHFTHLKRRILTKNGLRMSLICKPDEKTSCCREVILYSRLCNNLAELILLDHRFSETLRSPIVCATTLKIDCGVSFADAKMTNISQDLLVSKFFFGFFGASFASCMRHARMKKFALRNSMSFKYFEKSVACMFGVT